MKHKISSAMARELDRLANNRKGVLHPSEVIEFAKNKKTALHNHFTWDDSEAANRWRLEEAKYLLRSHVTVLPGTETETRCFVSLTSDRGGDDGSYRLTSRVMSNEEYRTQLLADAKEELESFRKKYAALKELERVFRAIDEL